MFHVLQSLAALLSHLFDGDDSAAQVQHLRQFLLDGLQPFVAIAMIDLLLYPIAPTKAVFLIQRVNLSDLGSKARDLFPKNFQMIHATRIPHFAAAPVPL